MNIPNGYVPKEGDIVIIHAVVHGDYDPGDKTLFVRLRRHDCVGIDPSKVIGLYARRWEVGNRVRGVHNEIGEVVAVSDNMVWVRLDRGGFNTFSANNLLPEEPTNPLSTAIAAGRAPTAEEVAESIQPPPKAEEEEVQF
jgi:hypothetical protein